MKKIFSILIIAFLCSCAVKDADVTSVITSTQYTAVTTTERSTESATEEIKETTATVTDETTAAAFTASATDSININVLDYAPWISSTNDPIKEDLVSMTFEEIREYYGTEITPGYLPEYVVGEDMSAVYGGNSGIYMNEDGEIYSDKYSLVYLCSEDFDYYKEYGDFDYEKIGHMPFGVFINIGKQNALGTGIRWDDDGVLVSNINGYDIYLASLASWEETRYWAVFDKDNVHFMIYSIGIIESDFLKIVSSYF